MVILKQFYQWLLPTFCVLCRGSASGAALCDPCYRDLPWQHSVCRQCAASLMHAEICGECLQSPPAYDNTISLFHYQAPVDHLLLALKFHKKLAYANLLGRLLAEKAAAHYAGQTKPELLIPVPLHPQRLRERGYNQALEIARPVAKRLKLPIDTHYCRRQLLTSPQSSVSEEERRRNMKNAFVVDSRLPAKHVAIVDDVMTTGSTAAELARVLRLAGAERVDVWCCAKTVLRGA